MKVAVPILITSMSLSACLSEATGSYGGSSSAARELTPQEAALEKQERAFRGTVVEAAAAGAILGGLIGGLAGGDAQSALIGVAAGGALGATSGYYVGKRQKEFASAENALDGAIAAARADNAELASYVNTARQTVSQQQSNLSSLRRQLSEGKISREQYEAEYAAAQKTRNSIATFYSTSEGYQNDLQSGAAKASAENGSAANAYVQQAQTFANQRNEVRQILLQSDAMLDAFRLD